MALSWEKFLVCVNDFLSISTTIDDGWTMIEQADCRKLPENCYLVKTVISEVIKKLPETNAVFEEDISVDLSTLQAPSGLHSETVVWEYHIIYSPSYSVPVLYFNVKNTSGKSLALDKLWNILNIPEEVLLEKWSFVTQQEHPILLKPFFYLHPCKSCEFLKISKNSSVNPVVTWLSSIAYIVHLKVPLEYGLKTFTI